MNLPERTARYAEIEAARGRPLIVYATSTRQGTSAMMAGDAVRELIDQIDRVSGDKVDVLIHSTGGDPLAAWKLMSVLRERFNSVSVLVPYMAFSAATLFALGADEIVMHPHASLGPIDPQITIRTGNTNRQFSFEDVGAFLRFLVEEVKVTEQQPFAGVVNQLFSVVDPVHLGAAKRASELSTTVGERLLQMHMTTPELAEEARRIAERLNKSFFAHGDAVSRSRARSLNLKIASDNKKLEALMWNAYSGIEGYLQLREPFNPLHYFLGNGGAAAVVPTGPLALPANAPPQLAQQLWGQVAQNALQAMAQPAVEVPYKIVNAIIESTRVASEYRSEGKLTAARIGGGEIQIAGVEHSSRWHSVAVPETSTGPKVATSGQNGSTS